MKYLQWLTIIGIIILPFPARADDALSMLVGNGLEAFTLGTIWVLIVEFAYCRYRFKHTSNLRNILFVITANVATTIMGFFLLLLTPDSEVYFTESGIMWRFLICYLCTVPVEALILKQFLRSTEQLSFLSAFINSVLFNIFSYIGIVAIFFILPQKYSG